MASIKSSRAGICQWWKKRVKSSWLGVSLGKSSMEVMLASLERSSERSLGWRGGTTTSYVLGRSHKRERPGGKESRLNFGVWTTSALALVPRTVFQRRDSRVPNSGVFFRVVEKALSRFAKANDLLGWGTVAFRTGTLCNTVKTECEFEVYLVANGREPHSSVCQSQACYFRETSERTA